MDNQQMPIGFGFALAMNENALDRFSKLTEAEKEKAIAESRYAKSKNEMDRIVSALAEDDHETLSSIFNR